MTTIDETQQENISALAEVVSSPDAAIDVLEQGAEAIAALAEKGIAEIAESQEAAKKTISEIQREYTVQIERQIEALRSGANDLLGALATKPEEELTVPEKARKAHANYILENIALVESPTFIEDFINSDEIFTASKMRSYMLKDSNVVFIANQSRRALSKLRSKQMEKCGFIDLINELNQNASPFFNDGANREEFEKFKIFTGILLEFILNNKLLTGFFIYLSLIILVVRTGMKTGFMPIAVDKAYEDFVSRYNRIK